MISAVLGILTIGASGVWLWPLARRWLWPLRGQPCFEGLALVAGLSLSLGVLSLLMLGLGLLPGAWLQPVTILPIPWLGLAGSAWLERSQWVDALRVGLPAEWRQRLRTHALSWWLGLVGVGGLIVIAINAISYPFYRSDLLNRYGPQARELFSAGHMPQAMTGYPPGVPMLYALAFFAAGAVNDHMAGMIIVAYAAAMLGAVWLVARLFAGQGRLAVVFALSAPLFVDWATSGYVDVPEGVYRGLALAFAYFWLERGDKRFAILVGLMCGLALWMKQSSLALLPSLAVVPVLRLWKTDRSNWARELGQTGLMAAALLVVVLPWYGRSFLLGGPGSLFVSANPLDVQGADHSPSLLLVFWERRNLWGWPLALTVLPGLLISVWLLIRRPQTRLKWLLLLAFTVPYHLIWWSSFTFETRYLLPSLPMYAALAALAAEWLFDRLGRVLGCLTPWLIAIAAAGMVLYGTYSRLGAVYYLLTDPTQTDDVKLTRLSPETWPMAKYIGENVPHGTPICSMNTDLIYWLHDYDLHFGYFLPEDVRGCDYYLVAYWGENYAGDTWPGITQALADPQLFTEVFRGPAGGQILYKVNFR